MILVAVLPALALTIALLVNQRHYQARMDRLLNVIITERASSETRVSALLAHHAQPHPDTTALISLVERMAQRIQAPANAVIEHGLAQPIPDSPPAVLPDDDSGYWAAQEPSKEALAEALMAQEIHAT